MGDHSAHQLANQRLDSWKEIAAFFDRDERTVRRWEKERGLPAHRVPGGARGAVFAYTDELRDWLKGPGAELEGADSEVLQPVFARSESSQPTETPEQTAAVASDRQAAPRLSLARIVIWVAPLLAVIALIAVFSYSQHETRYRNALAAPRRPAPEAQELYLKGEYHWTKRTPEDPEEAYPRALAAAQKAVELDDTSAGSHNSLAFDTFYRKWDSAIAEREFKPALALDPNFVQGHHWYATFLLTSGRRLHEALDRIELARKLDPSSTTIQADKAWILFYAGRKSEAFSLLKQLESTDPALAATHDYLATIYFDRKDYDNFFAESK